MDIDSRYVTGPPPQVDREKHSPDHERRASHYDREIDLDSDSTHAVVIRLVGGAQRVLELGPATGRMSQVLRDRGCADRGCADRGCAVVAIEIDPEMATLAARYCERVIVGDLDTLDLDAELGSDRFDVIVAADVLEHLKDPLTVLQRLRGYLEPEGFFVISLPNVAHGSVRLALLEGRFPYQRVGLLDETHLRFFTRETVDQLLDRAELGVAEVYNQQLDIDASEVPFDQSSVPAEVMNTLEHDPEARTYQFVIKAIPFEVHGLREFQRRLRELAHQNASLRELTQENAGLRKEIARQQELQEALTAIASREGQLRSALIDAHDQMLRRDEELHTLQEKVEAADTETAAQQEQVLRLRVRLDRILNSPPARAYEKVRELPGVRSVVGRRTASYEEALRSAKGRSERLR